MAFGVTHPLAPCGRPIPTIAAVWPPGSTRSSHRARSPCGRGTADPLADGSADGSARAARTAVVRDGWFHAVVDAGAHRCVLRPRRHGRDRRPVRRSAHGLDGFTGDDLELIVPRAPKPSVHSARPFDRRPLLKSDVQRVDGLTVVRAERLIIDTPIFRFSRSEIENADRLVHSTYAACPNSASNRVVGPSTLGRQEWRSVRGIGLRSLTQCRPLVDAGGESRLERWFLVMSSGQDCRVRSCRTDVSPRRAHAGPCRCRVSGRAGRRTRRPRHTRRPVSSANATPSGARAHFFGQAGAHVHLRGHARPVCVGDRSGIGCRDGWPRDTRSPIHSSGRLES